MKKIAVSCILLLLFSACTVVRTNYSDVVNQKQYNILYYYLPETVLNITATAKVDSYYLGDEIIEAVVTERKYTITPETIADTRNLLILEYKKNGLFSDDLSFTVNEKGLLSNLIIKTEDQTASIIEDIAKTFADFQPKILQINAKIDVVKTEYTRNYKIKASDITTIGKQIPWLIEVINKNSPEKIKPIDETYTIKTLDGLSSKPFDFEKLDNGVNKDKYIEGIFTRPIRNLDVLIQPVKYPQDIHSNYVQISDPSKLIVLPIRRTAFVKTTNDLTINDGIIRVNKIDKPSAVKGFVQIPINIAKAVVAIPSQIIQIKINNETANKNLLTAEKDRLNTELQYKLELIKINKKLDSLSRVR